MEKALLLLVASCSIVHGNQPAKEKKPYPCFVDVCNRHEDIEWQFCDANQRRCEYCSNRRNLCLSPDMPRNCSEFCRGVILKQEQVNGCEPMTKPLHGSHNGSEIGRQSYGDVIQLTCDAGYQCYGPCSATCSDYGMYTSALICKEDPLEKKRVNGCEPMTKPLHGSHNGSEIGRQGYGDVIQLTCDAGYQCYGPCSAICSDYGMYTSALICKGMKETKEDLYLKLSIGGFCGLMLAMIIFCTLFTLCAYKIGKQNERKYKDKSKPQELKPPSRSSKYTMLPNHDTFNESDETNKVKKRKDHQEILYDRPNTEPSKRARSSSSADVTSSMTQTDFNQRQNATETDLNSSNYTSSNVSRTASSDSGLPPNIHLHVSTTFNTSSTNNNNNTVTKSDEDKVKFTQSPQFDKIPTEETCKNNAGKVPDTCRPELDETISSSQSFPGACDVNNTFTMQNDTGCTRQRNSQQSLGFETFTGHNHVQADDEGAKVFVAIGDRTVPIDDIAERDQHIAIHHGNVKEEQVETRTVALGDN